MKWLAALAAMALAHTASARGLKVPRELEANAVESKELEAENEALRKRNRDLESMMQLARAEVQRMDAAASAHKRRRENCVDGDTEVLKQEIEDLRNKLRSADTDKNDLVQSLRHMLAKNSTQTFQRQAERAEALAERAQEMKMTLEVKCGKERQTLEAQLQAVNGKCADTKEVAEHLQAENAELRQKLQGSSAELAKTAQTIKELSSDKKNLVATMQGLMRENTRFKHELKKDTEIEKKQVGEIAAGKALLAKLNKKVPTASATKQVKAVLKVSPRHHEHLTDAQRTHMKEIDRYIDSAEPASDEVDNVSEQQLRAVQRQGDLVAKGKVTSHLGEWLGLKAPLAQPPAGGAAPTSSLSPTTASAKPKAVADDGGEAEAEDLVTQAKAQLAAMDQDDAGS